MNADYLPHSVPVTTTKCDKDLGLEDGVELINSIGELLFQWLHSAPYIGFHHRPFRVLKHLLQFCGRLQLGLEYK